MFARIFTQSIILIIFEQWHYCMIKDPTHELSSVRYSSIKLHRLEFYLMRFYFLGHFFK